MHILCVEEDVREDCHHENFMSKVIPRNSVRLLNLVGEGRFVSISVAKWCHSMLARVLITLVYTRSTYVCACLCVSLVEFSL